MLRYLSCWTVMHDLAGGRFEVTRSIERNTAGMTINASCSEGLTINDQQVPTIRGLPRSVPTIETAS